VSFGGLNMSGLISAPGIAGTSIQVVGRIKVRLRFSELPILPLEPLEPPDPYDVDLTERGLRGLDFPPIVAGDKSAIRVGVRQPDDSAAIDLTGAFVLMTASDAGNIIITRRSDTSPQIVLDAQTTDNGPTGTAGRGWLQINFDSSEQAAMEAGDGDALAFDLRANIGGNVATLLRGKIQFVLPVTEEVE